MFVCTLNCRWVCNTGKVELFVASRNERGGTVPSRWSGVAPGFGSPASQHVPGGEGSIGLLASWRYILTAFVAGGECSLFFCACLAPHVVLDTRERRSLSLSNPGRHQGQRRCCADEWLVQSLTTICCDSLYCIGVVHRVKLRQNGSSIVFSVGQEQVRGAEARLWAARCRICRSCAVEWISPSYRGASWTPLVNI